MGKDTDRLRQFDQSHLPKAPLLSRRGALIGGAVGTLLALGGGTFAWQRLFPQKLDIRTDASYFKDGEPNVLSKFKDEEGRKSELFCIPVHAHQGLFLATGSLDSGEKTTNFGVAGSTPSISLAIATKNNSFNGIIEFPKPNMPNQILTVLNEGYNAPNGADTAYFVYKVTGSTTQGPQYFATVCSSQDEINAARDTALSKYSGTMTFIKDKLSWSGDSGANTIPVYKEVVVLPKS